MGNKDRIKVFLKKIIEIQNRPKTEKINEEEVITPKKRHGIDHELRKIQHKVSAILKKDEKIMRIEKNEEEKIRLLEEKLNAFELKIREDKRPIRNTRFIRVNDNAANEKIKELCKKLDETKDKKEARVLKREILRLKHKVGQKSVIIEEKKEEPIVAIKPKEEKDTLKNDIKEDREKARELKRKILLEKHKLKVQKAEEPKAEPEPKEQKLEKIQSLDIVRHETILPILNPLSLEKEFLLPEPILNTEKTQVPEFHEQKKGFFAKIFKKK